MNRIKKFIDNNRREFDDQVPAENVWDKIAANIPQEKKARLFSIKDVYKWTAVAAIACIALTSVYFLFIRKNSREPVITKVEKAPEHLVSPDDISGIAPEYADEAKAAYQAIEARQLELKNAATTHPDLYKQFSQDLGILDSSYRVLKNQSGETPNRELIIRAMLQNLQLQGELLSRQLMIIHEFKNDKNSKNEKST